MQLEGGKKVVSLACWEAVRGDRACDWLSVAPELTSVIEM